MRIAIVGASGYGNVGDDTYPLVFKHYLPDHQLAFYNSDLPAHLPPDIKLMIFGGGGLIYNSDIPRLRGHFDYMKFYMEWAATLGIPWGFISCGLQMALDGNGEYRVDQLKPWIPYIKRAHFITLRSAKGVEILKNMSHRDDINHYPDLAYLFSPSIEKRPMKQVLLICAGNVSPQNASIQHLIGPFLTTEHKLVAMGMGSPADDRKHLEVTKELYPHAEVIANPSPSKALSVVAQSSFVITGRYHGMVFARIAKVPFWRPIRGPFKIVHEDIFSDIATAEGHIQVVKAQIGSLPRL